MCTSKHAAAMHNTLNIAQYIADASCIHANNLHLHMNATSDTQQVSTQYGCRRAMANVDQADEIGKKFAEHFYNTFKTNKQGLGGLYHSEGILNWEGQRHVGQQAITQKHNSLPFNNIDFKFRTIDCQPTAGGGVIVFVTGQLLTEGETKPLDFSQVFHLVSANSSWVLSNDMFRLNYG